MKTCACHPGAPREAAYRLPFNKMPVCAETAARVVARLEREVRRRTPEPLSSEESR